MKATQMSGFFICCRFLQIYLHGNLQQIKKLIGEADFQVVCCFNALPQGKNERCEAAAEHSEVNLSPPPTLKIKMLQIIVTSFSLPVSEIFK